MATVYNPPGNMEFQRRRKDLLRTEGTVLCWNFHCGAYLGKTDYREPTSPTADVTGWRCSVCGTETFVVTQPR